MTAMRWLMLGSAAIALAGAGGVAALAADTAAEASAADGSVAKIDHGVVVTPLWLKVTMGTWK